MIDPINIYVAALVIIVTCASFSYLSVIYIKICLRRLDDETISNEDRERIYEGIMLDFIAFLPEYTIFYPLISIENEELISDKENPVNI